MNERFKELMEQSTYDVLGVKQIDQQQFAELIVKDCLRFVETGRDKTDIKHLITACFLMD